MKKLLKLIIILSLNLYIGSSFSMRYRPDEETEDFSAINVESKLLEFEEFNSIFPGKEKDKQEVFDTFYIHAVTITNPNSVDYRIYSNNDQEINIEKLFKNSKLLKAGCNCLNSTILTAGALCTIFVESIVYLLQMDGYKGPMNFNDIKAILEATPIALVPLIFSSVIVCTNKSCTKFFDKTKKFLSNNVLIPGLSVIDRNSTITKYLITNDKDLNLSFEEI